MRYKRGKKGQIFGIYLVVITLLMCFTAILAYEWQNKKVGNSVAVPADLLNLQNDLKLFEIQEKNLILVSAGESLALKGWNTNGFLQEFESRFLNYLGKEKNNLGNFIPNDLTGVYSFIWDGNNLKISRADITKNIKLLMPKKSSNIAFPVEIDYTYDKEYLIKLDEVENLK